MPTDISKQSHIRDTVLKEHDYADLEAVKKQAIISIASEIVATANKRISPIFSKASRKLLKQAKALMADEERKGYKDFFNAVVAYSIKYKGKKKVFSKELQSVAKTLALKMPIDISKQSHIRDTVLKEHGYADLEAVKKQATISIASEIVATANKRISPIFSKASKKLLKQAKALMADEERKGYEDFFDEVVAYSIKYKGKKRVFSKELQSVAKTLALKMSNFQDQIREKILEEQNKEHTYANVNIREEEPIYENLNPVRTTETSTVSSLPSFDEVLMYANKICGKMDDVPENFKISMEENQAPEDAKEEYKHLAVPTFTKEEDASKIPDFNTMVNPSWLNMPCPKKTAITVNGQLIYHGNQVNTLRGGSYLACQGPREAKNNAPNFWRMLEAKKPNVIIDLTNATDPKKSRQTQAYNSPEEIIQEAKTKGGLFTIQDILVNKRRFTRIQLNSFHDKTSGVAAHLVALSLIALFADGRSAGKVSEIPKTKKLKVPKTPKMAEPKRPEVPIAVHCSGGIGRTATCIIAIDEVTAFLAGEARQPVPEAIATVRNARGPSAVQTPEQLVTLNTIHDRVGEIIPLLI